MELFIKIDTDGFPTISALALDGFNPISKEELQEIQSFIKPRLINQRWVEAATPEEIHQLQSTNQLDQLKYFMAKKKEDGEAYYNEIELALTIVLAGLPLQELVSVNREIEDKIKPIINEIKIGDWFNAYMKLWINQEIERPTSLLLAQTFDNIKVRVKNYFETNYPR